MIPVAALLKVAPYIALVVGLGMSHTYAYVKGSRNAEERHVVAVAKLKEEARKIESSLQDKVDVQNTKLEAERVRRDRAEKKQQEKVQVYVTKIDPSCPSIGGEFRVLHDAGANPKPDPDSATAPVRDGPPRGPDPPATPTETDLATTPGQVIQTVSENYRTARVWRQQVVECQQYINNVVRPFFATAGE